MPRKKRFPLLDDDRSNGELGTMERAERTPTVKLSAVKKDYLRYIMHSLKLAKSTHTTYQSWLNRYEGWLADNGYPDPDLEDAFDPLVLQTYYYSLAQHKSKGASELRPRTLHAAFHPIRGLGNT